MKNFNIKKFLNFILRLNIFIFSYLLYLIQLLLIFFNFKNFAKHIFNCASLFCSLSRESSIGDRTLGFSKVTSSFSSFFVRGDRDTLTHASHEPRWKPLHHRSQYIAYKGEAKEIEVIKSPLPWEYLKEENVPQNFDWSR